MQSKLKELLYSIKINNAPKLVKTQKPVQLTNNTHIQYFEYLKPLDGVISNLAQGQTMIEKIIKDDWGIQYTQALYDKFVQILNKFASTTKGVMQYYDEAIADSQSAGKKFKREKFKNDLDVLYMKNLWQISHNKMIEYEKIFEQKLNNIKAVKLAKDDIVMEIEEKQEKKEMEIENLANEQQDEYKDENKDESGQVNDNDKRIKSWLEVDQLGMDPNQNPYDMAPQSQQQIQQNLQPQQGQVSEPVQIQRGLYNLSKPEYSGGMDIEYIHLDDTFLKDPTTQKDFVATTKTELNLVKESTDLVNEMLNDNNLRETLIESLKFTDVFDIGKKKAIRNRKIQKNSEGRLFAKGVFEKYINSSKVKYNQKQRQRIVNALKMKPTMRMYAEDKLDQLISSYILDAQKLANELYEQVKSSLTVPFMRSKDMQNSVTFMTMEKVISKGIDPALYTGEQKDSVVSEIAAKINTQFNVVSQAQTYQRELQDRIREMQIETDEQLDYNKMTQTEIQNAQPYQIFQTINTLTGKLKAQAYTVGWVPGWGTMNEDIDYRTFNGLTDNQLQKAYDKFKEIVQFDDTNAKIDIDLDTFKGMYRQNPFIVYILEKMLQELKQRKSEQQKVDSINQTVGQVLATIKDDPSIYSGKLIKLNQELKSLYALRKLTIRKQKEKGSQYERPKINFANKVDNQMLIEALKNKYNHTFDNGTLFKFTCQNTLGAYIKIAKSELSKISFVCFGYYAPGKYTSSSAQIKEGPQQIVADSIIDQQQLRNYSIFQHLEGDHYTLNLEFEQIDTYIQTLAKTIMGMKDQQGTFEEFKKLLQKAKREYDKGKEQLDKRLKDAEEMQNNQNTINDDSDEDGDVYTKEQYVRDLSGLFNTSGLSTFGVTFADINSLNDIIQQHTFLQTRIAQLGYIQNLEKLQRSMSFQPIVLFKKIKSELQVKPKAWYGYMNSWLEIAGRYCDVFDNVPVRFCIFVGYRQPNVTLESVTDRISLSSRMLRFPLFTSLVVPPAKLKASEIEQYRQLVKGIRESGFDYEEFNVTATDEEIKDKLSQLRNLIRGVYPYQPYKINFGSTVLTEEEQAIVTSYFNYFPNSQFGMIDYTNFLRLLGAIRAKNYAVQKEKVKISQRRKYKILNHDRDQWNRVAEYFIKQFIFIISSQ